VGRDSPEKYIDLKGMEKVFIKKEEWGGSQTMFKGGGNSFQIQSTGGRVRVFGLKEKAGHIWGNRRDTKKVGRGGCTKGCGHKGVQECGVFCSGGITRGSCWCSRLIVEAERRKQAKDRLASMFRFLGEDLGGKGGGGGATSSRNQS